MAAGDSTARGNRQEMAPGRAASLGRPRPRGHRAGGALSGRQPGTLTTLQGFWHLETLKLDGCNMEGCYCPCKATCKSRPGFRPAVEPGKILYSSNRMRYAHCASSQQRAR